MAVVTGRYILTINITCEMSKPRVSKKALQNPASTSGLAAVVDEPVALKADIIATKVAATASAETGLLDGEEEIMLSNTTKANGIVTDVRILPPSIQVRPIFSISLSRSLQRCVLIRDTCYK